MFAILDGCAYEFELEGVVMRVIEPGVMQAFPDGVLQGAHVTRAVKLYEDVASLYEHPRTDNPVVYEVYSDIQGDPVPGNLLWGLTILKPVDSNGECNMTRGHWHKDLACAEYYFCLSGAGLLMLMDETGRTWAERMFAGSVHHIDGRLAHRCVNTSEDQDLRFGACWPSAAGHDYARVEAMEFAYRVKRVNGELVFESRR